MRTRLAITFLLASALPAAAAGPVPVILGEGTNSCAEYTEGRLLAEQLDKSYFDWAQGFMSGMNVMLSTAKSPTRNVTHLSDDDMKKALQNYCSAHPDDPFVLAVTKTFATLPEISSPSP